MSMVRCMRSESDDSRAEPSSLTSTESRVKRGKVEFMIFSRDAVSSKFVLVVKRVHTGRIISGEEHCDCGGGCIVNEHDLN